MPLSIDCPITPANPQRVRITLNPTDTDGTPRDLQDGTVSIEIQEGDGATQVLDNRNLLVRPGSAVVGGVTRGKFGGDADLTDGRTLLEDTFEIRWTAPMATNLGAGIAVEADV